MNKELVLIIILIVLILFLFCVKCKNEKFVNSTKNIDKIYVINLKRNKDRLNVFMKRAKDANVKVERFEAVNGKELPKNHPDIVKYFIKNHNLNPGQIGCALSHIKIWEDAIKNNYKNIIVFEDDAIIPVDFWNRFNKAYNNLPSDWKVSYLGLNWPHVKKINQNVSKVIYKKGTSNFGTHAMLINIDKISKLLAIKINVPIDIFIKNNNDSDIYFFHNIKIVNDSSFDSNIGKKLNNHSNKIKNIIKFI